MGLQNVDKAAVDLNEQHNAVNFGAGGAGAAAAFGLKVAPLTVVHMQLPIKT